MLILHSFILSPFGKEILKGINLKSFKIILFSFYLRTILLPAFTYMLEVGIFIVHSFIQAHLLKEILKGVNCKSLNATICFFYLRTCLPVVPVH